MKQEDKELLLKDLCARLPYGVKCKVFDFATPYTLSGVLPNNGYDELYFKQLDFKESDGYASVKFCKPYLFPLSSMTEEQSLKLEIITGETIGFDAYSLHDFTGYFEISLSKTLEIIQWCYGNHFDINGLIPMGLVNDATGLNIY